MKILGNTEIFILQKHLVQKNNKSFGFGFLTSLATGSKEISNQVRAKIHYFIKPTQS